MKKLFKILAIILVFILSLTVFRHLTGIDGKIGKRQMAKVV